MTHRPTVSVDQSGRTSTYKLVTRTQPALPTAPVNVLFQEGRIVGTLLKIAAFLVLAGLLSVLTTVFTSNFLGRNLLVSLFNLSGDNTIPAMFSALILLLAALLLGMIAWARRQASGADALSWKLLSFVFGFLALDEAVMIHERTATITQKLLGTTGALHYAWVIPYGLLALTILVVFLRFLIHLPADIRWRILLAGVIYVGGALGFEMIEGLIVTATGSDQSLPNLLAIVPEEALEMGGVIVFISALLRYIRLYLPGLKLQLGLAPAAEPGQKV